MKFFKRSEGIIFEGLIFDEDIVRRNLDKIINILLVPLFLKRFFDISMF
jgi:hypothetical protein